MSSRTFIASWSGGKDSCLALWRAVQSGSRPAGLLNMLDESGARSRSHGLSPALLQAQAAAIGVPLYTASAAWQTYEREFVAALQRCQAQGVDTAVFGDIDLEDHRAWEEKVCTAAGLTPWLPLWQASRLDLVREFVDAGFQARIVVVNTDLMSENYLGAEFNHALIERMLADGLDPCGEAGEFHTVVTGGPLFSQPLTLHEAARQQHQNYVMLDYIVADADAQINP